MLFVSKLRSAGFRKKLSKELSHLKKYKKLPKLYNILCSTLMGNFSFVRTVGLTKIIEIEAGVGNFN